MNILYLDKANSLDEIRIAERTIWVDEMPKFGYEMFFLLKKINKKSFKKKERIRNNTSFVPDYKFKFFGFINFIAVLFRVLMVNNIKLIVVRNVVDLGFIALIFAKVFRIEILYIKAFPLIESKIRKVKKSRFSDVRVSLLSVVLKVEVFLMKKSTYLISRTEKFSKDLRENYGISREIVSIPMGFDVNSLNKLNREKINLIKETYKIIDCFTLIYFGSLNSQRNINFIINVVEKASLVNKKIKCFIIGGPNEDLLELKNTIQLKKIENNFFLLEEMDRDDLFDFVQVSDVSISPIPPIEEYILSSPTKVVESLALGCPVIANEEILDQKEIIKDSKGGICLPYDEDEFVSTLLDLSKYKDDLRIMSLAGSKYVLKNRSYNELTKLVIKYINT